MVDVQVTIWIQGKDVAARDVKDSRVRAALTQMGKDLGQKLQGVKCPTHGGEAKDVRVKIDKSGNGDLRYDACCPELSKLIAKATG